MLLIVNQKPTESAEHGTHALQSIELSFGLERVNEHGMRASMFVVPCRQNHVDRRRLFGGHRA